MNLGGLNNLTLELQARKERFEKERQKRSNHDLQGDNKLTYKGESRSSKRTDKGGESKHNPAENLNLQNDEYKYDSDDSDELMEITDKYGRARQVPRRQAHLYDEGYDSEDSQPSDDLRPESVIYGNVVQHESFNVDKMEEMTRRALEQREESDDNLQPHYSADWENRTKSAGFIRFNKNERERQKQLDDVAKLHKSTAEIQSSVSKVSEEIKSARWKALLQEKELQLGRPK